MLATLTSSPHPHHGWSLKAVVLLRASANWSWQFDYDFFSSSLKGTQVMPGWLIFFIKSPIIFRTRGVHKLGLCPTQTRLETFEWVKTNQNRPGMLVESAGSSRVGFSGSPVGFGFYLLCHYFGRIRQDLADI